MKELSEFGKFPALEKNWKPSDFNKREALIYFKETESFDFRIYTSIEIKHMLHFELHLSRDLIIELFEDYMQFTDGIKIEDSPSRLNEITTRYVDDDL